MHQKKRSSVNELEPLEKDKLQIIDTQMRLNT